MYSIELRLLSTHYVEDFMAFYVRRNLYHARIIHVICLGFLFWVLRCNFRTDNFREIIIKLLQVYMTPPVQGKEKKENINVLKLKLTNLNLIVII